MQVNVAGIRRNLKNLAHNYSDAQRKVREATSNDPWGPSSTLMGEIADLTYNVVAFTEIMQMIWKRLNDHGRNWRHVYKALVVLEYLIKTGSEKVAQQCKENIFAIQTLKDFQYLEEGKDQGQSVREKAKHLVNLLKDDEKLKNERARALKAKERFAQSASAFGSDGGLDTPSSPKYPAFRGDWSSSRDSGNELPRDLEVARPQTAGEEELQLQLALAMSREEAEQEEQKRRSDDVRLQLALSQSQQDFKAAKEKQSNVLDLLDTNPPEGAAADPWGVPQPPRPKSTPWQSNSFASPTHQVDPWQPSTGAAAAAAVAVATAAAAASKPADPWNPVTAASPPTKNHHDPWSPASQGSSTDLDEFDVITNRNKTSPKTNGTSNNNHTNNNNNNSSDPFELSLLGDSLPSTGLSPSTGATKKTPQSFLGENSALVNLDNLVTSNKPTPPPLAANPFSDQQPDPLLLIPKPTINEMKQTPPFVPSSTQFVPSAATYTPTPLAFAGLPTTAAAPFASAQQPFSTNNGLFAGAAVATAPDPWTPVPAGNANAQLGAPWVKQEPANPFLS